MDDGSCTENDFVTVVLSDSYGDGWGLSSAFGGFIFNGDSTSFDDGAELSLELPLDDGCYMGQVVIPGFYAYEGSWAVYASNGTLLIQGDNAPSGVAVDVPFYVGQPDCLLVGCMNPLACDFEPLATMPGLCEDFLSCAGCTDDEACNYNPTATVLLAGSCDYSCVGCLDSTALNYCGDCTIDDAASCLYCEGTYYDFYISDSWGDGQTSPLADGYALVIADGDTLLDVVGDWFDPLPSTLADTAFCVASDACVYVEVLTDQYTSETDFALTNVGTGEILLDGTGSIDQFAIYSYASGSCVLGCTDATACNYAADADIDDASCDYSCIGCMDSGAANFDPEATLPGECVFCESGVEFLVSIEAFDAGGDGWNSTWALYTDGQGTPDTSGTVTAADGGSVLTNICLAPGCYYFQTTNDASPSEVSVVVSDAFGTTYPTIGSGEIYYLDFATNSCGYTGCTDQGALNYDPSANVDDGSCNYPPSNDTYENAAGLACGTSVTGSLAFAQDEEGLAGTEFGQTILAGGSVWYEINSDADQAITISTCDTPDALNGNDFAFDTELAILTEDADGALTILGTNSQGCDAGTHASIQFYAYAGSDYLIRVTGSGNPEFVISASCDADAATPPSNDVCENAIVVPNGESVLADLCGSQTEAVWLPWSGGDPANFEYYDGATAYSQWFAFNSADFDGFYFSGTNESDLEGSTIGVALMLGSCDSISPYLGGVVTGQVAGPTTDFGLELEANTNYYFVIWTEDPDACGQASLFVEGIIQGCMDPAALNYDPQANEETFLCEYEEGFAPANDECDGAIALECNTSVEGTTAGATASGAPDQCSAAGPLGAGVWYSFVGDSSLVSLDLCASVIDSKLTVVSADTACGGASIGTPPADPCDSLVTVNWTLGGGSFFNETYFSIADTSGAVVIQGGGASAYISPTASAGSACLAPGDYTVSVLDTYGDSWNGNVLELTNNLGELLGTFANSSAAGANEFESFDISIAPYSTEPIVIAGDYECIAQSIDGGELCDFFDADDASVQFVSEPGTQYYVYVQSEDQDFDPITSESGSFTLNMACEEVVEGCMIDAACNYNPMANVAADCDFYSCLCADSTGVPVAFNMFDGFYISFVETAGDGWNGATYSIIDAGDSTVVASGSIDDADVQVDEDNYTGNEEGTDYFCLAPGCYDIVVTGGDFPTEVGWNLSLADGTIVEEGPFASSPFSTVATGVGTWSVSIGGALCGCMDTGACNYDPAATSEDGSCEYITCAGCMDTSACNFDSDALVPDNDQCCYGNCVDVELFDSYGDGWNSGAYYVLSTIDGEEVGTGTLNFGESEGIDSYCLNDGCYVIEFVSGGSIWDYEAQLTLTGAFGGIVQIGCGATSGADCDTDGPLYAPATINVGTGTECTPGCQVPTACNYNPEANFGGLEQCDFSDCSGCTYETASNYQTIANGGLNADGTPNASWEAPVLDDGSCEFIIANPCPADLNGDGSVSTADLLEFLTAFGSSC